MTRKCKYVLAGLSLAASAATSIYFGVSSFFPVEAPFQNTAYQVKNPGKEFIRGGPSDSKWEKKYKNFSTEFVDEGRVKNAFGDTVLNEYPNLLKGYSKTNPDEGKIKKFLYEWCQKNRDSKDENKFSLIGVWCIYEQN